MADAGERPTSVYIIECMGYVKIGVARNPLQRLSDINTCVPIRAELRFSREFDDSLIAHYVESSLHRIFRKCRCNGEWFDLTPLEAWDALRKAKPPRLKDRTARHGTLQRWGSSDDPTITNLLTRNMTIAAPAHVSAKIGE